MGVSSRLRRLRRRVWRYRRDAELRRSTVNPIYSYVAVGVLVLITAALVVYVLALG